MKKRKKTNSTPMSVWIIQRRSRRRRGGWNAWRYVSTAYRAEHADQTLDIWRRSSRAGIEFRAVAYDKRMLGLQVRP